MAIWAIADLHLSFGVPDKKMDLFGEKWVDHPDKIRENWLRLIDPEDLVLIPGDISWAIRLEDALPDLRWIDALPGTKVMLRGNHDYWWSSPSKMEKILPPSIRLIQNNAFCWHDIGICGARLWDTPEYSFNDYIDYYETPEIKKVVHPEHHEDDQKIFARELVRLELSLKALPISVNTRIAMTHYPPIGPEMAPSATSALLEKYRIQICTFGHLHNVRHAALPYGIKNGVRYHLTAADYIDFCPIKIL